VRDAPWDYLLRPFTPYEFVDLFNPTWILASILLAIQILIYWRQTRRLHRFPPLLDLQEWLLWTGITTFGLIITMAVFKWYFLFVLVTILLGLATYVWVRFVRFPPIIRGYNEQLRRARFFSESRYKHPEATIRSKRAKRRRR
jgi:hypothetical protein